MTALERFDTKEWRAAHAIGLLLSWGLVACSAPIDQTRDPTPNPTPVSVTGVTLDRSTLSLTVGGSTTMLVATVSPSNAASSAVTWSSNNSAVAAVNATGVVSPGAAGSATITVTTQDGAKTATCAVTVVANIVAVTGISLDKTALDLVAGGPAVTLVATITPATATNQKVTWQSSAVTVATVSDSGSIAPLAAGTTTIVAKTADGSKAASCVVTVTAAAIAVSGVALDTGTLNLTIGSVAPALVATVAPANATDKAISWSSDKPDVATVSAAGVVTGKAAGTAIITVTTHEGPFIASCSVTVTKPTNAVTGVTLTVKRLDLVVGGFAGKLTAAVAPSNADNPAVTWSSSDEKVAKVSSVGLVTIVGSGAASITVTTTERAFTDTCAITVHSDAVTSVASTYPLTGQIAISWTDPLDLNAVGVQVTMLSADGSMSRIVPVGTRKAAFTGLTVGRAYSFSIRTLGPSGTSSDGVSITGTPVQVVKGLRSNVAATSYITDTYGSALQADGGVFETHDIVMAPSEETANAGFPRNYRWILMPGLADPTDPSLVSLKNEEYLPTTTASAGSWVETNRYLHIRAEGVSNDGQFMAWCDWAPNGQQQLGLISPAAYADVYTDTGTFRRDATFRMLPRPTGTDAGTEVAGATYFQWLGDGSGNSYVIDVCNHIVALDSVTINNVRYARSIAWTVEDVAKLTP